MTTKNWDNRLKQDVYGSKEWRPVMFHDGKRADGSFDVTPGFKNVLTDQEVTGKEPPYRGGEAHGFRVSEAYRENYDRIFGGQKDA